MFTRTKDFERIIDDKDLLTIIENDTHLLFDAEVFAKDKIKSYLAHRYNLTHEFIDILPFDLNKRYYVSDLVEYTEPEWTAEKQYLAGERFSFEGLIYEVIQNVQGVQPPDNNYYAPLFEDKLLFTVRRETQGNYPDEPFRYNQSDTKFSELQGLKGWDRQSPLTVRRQGGYLEFYLENTLVGRTEYKEDFDLPQILKLQPIASSYKIGLRGEISLINYFAENEAIQITTENYFEQKDSRNKVLLDWTLKIMLYELHSRINPRYIPDLRVKQYDDVMKELDRASRGLVNIDLPLHVDEDDRNVPFIWGTSDDSQFKF